MATRVDGLTSLRRKIGLLKQVEEKAARQHVKRALVNVQSEAK